MHHFISQHIYLWLGLIFGWMLVTNIFPIMFFVLPEIFIFLWIFLAKFLPWYIPYLSIVLWAIIWEWINFYLWYKYWEKILEKKFFQKDLVKTYIEKLKNNPVKTLVIWKLIPGVIWIIPILSWVIKMNPWKFMITNSVMVAFSIFNMFLIWYFWISIFEKYFWPKVYIVIWILLVILLIYHAIKIIKKLGTNPSL